MSTFLEYFSGDHRVILTNWTQAWGYWPGFLWISCQLWSKFAITMSGMHFKLEKVFSRSKTVTSMASVAKIFGLFQNSGSISRDIRLLSHLQYFRLIKLESNFTECKLQYSLDSDWGCLLCEGTGLLHIFLELAAMLATLLSSPGGKEYVSRWNNSEKSRIDSFAKLTALLDLRHQIYAKSKKVISLEHTMHGVYFE